MIRTLTIVAALATTTIAHAQAVAPVQMRQLVLAPNTEVVVTPNDLLSTKSVKVGDKFRLATVFDVMQDGYVMIPKGTPGEGTVTYRTGTGAFGKSGKMEVELNSLDLNGQRVSLTGKHRQEGEGNTGAAVGAVVAVGVFGAFVKGRSATIANGQQIRARTAQPISFAVPASAPQVITAVPVAAPAAQAIVVTPAATPITTPAVSPAAVRQ